MNKQVVINTTGPTIACIAEMQLREEGVLQMAEWVKAHRPDCVPAEGFTSMWDLLPHDYLDRPRDGSAGLANPLGRHLADNETLVELSGRKCYDSFAEKAGQKTNAAYMQHIFSMDPVHASILYHAKLSFFFGGVSRKFSHQFIRNYVGSDRSEEGAPSQESTRFTHHYGHYICPPLSTEHPDTILSFRLKSQRNYDDYQDEIEKLRSIYPEAKRKEIFEAAAGFLSMSAETSFVWTTNPMALMKFMNERYPPHADAEMQRFVKVLLPVVAARVPNLLDPKLVAKIRAAST